MSRDPWVDALTLLTRRAYTRAEVAERLRRRGHDSEGVAGVLRRLEEYRLVDDERYAESYVESRRRRKGSLALRYELGAKGVDERLIERAVGPLDEEAELGAAVALLRGNLWRFRRGSADTSRARAFAFLARRGFPAGVAAEAVRAVAVEWLEAAS